MRCVSIPAATATAPQIAKQGSNSRDVVTHVAKRKIAAVTQQPAIASRVVAMVDIQAPTRVLSTACIALCRVYRFARLVWRQTVSLDRIRHVAPLRCSSISDPVRRASFLKMFRAILAHSQVFALPTSRLAQVSRDVVEAKVTDRLVLEASATGFRVHCEAVAARSTLRQQRVTV